MKNFEAVIIPFFFIATLICCNASRKKSDSTKKIRRIGETIADHHLIRKYESEHHKFYQETINEDGYLKWPNLDGKDLSKYCKMFFQQSIPTRTANRVNGIVIRKKMNYENEHSSITHRVFMVQCKIVSSHTVSYYMIRAPEPNCVYSLRYTRKKVIYTIINKYCDFEDELKLHKLQKRKSIKIISSLHHETGQPIADDEYLLQYELEHQELVRNVGREGGTIEWQHVIVHHNLNLYCYQYLGVCVPYRNRNGVRGKFKIVKLHYQKLNTNGNINVRAVQCLTHKVNRPYYYLTRAPEINCVYALLPWRQNIHTPLVIVFKHCNFEDPNEPQPMSQDVHDISDKNVITKTEVKEEINDTMELLQLFPNN